MKSEKLKESVSLKDRTASKIIQNIIDLSIIAEQYKYNCALAQQQKVITSHDKVSCILHNFLSVFNFNYVECYIFLPCSKICMQN